MYSRWQLAFKYFRYYLTASNGKGHGMHSPFFFHFIGQVLNDKQDYPALKEVEALRSKLMQDETKLIIDDFGAGSSLADKKQRSVSSLARHSAKSAKLAALLFRVVKSYQPMTIIELGTSLGLTTSYLSLAKPDAQLITIEGSPAIAESARKNFERLGLENISLLVGNFDQLLPEVLSNLKELDFAFVDGNHLLEPTQRYFENLLSRVNNDTILVFDDIHWSREMEQAWEIIKAHQATRATVDLFFVGIVFFRQEFKEKQHFTVRF